MTISTDMQPIQPRSSCITRVLLAFAALLVQGCALLEALPKNAGREEGRFWCSERYLHDVDEYKDKGLIDFNAPKYDLASRGYVYALAAALALQDNKSENADHSFPTPSYLKRVPELDRTAKRSTSGFQAATYEYFDPSANRKEIIIAFSGSNEWKDYYKHSARPFGAQFEPARRYVADVLKIYGNKQRIVASGFSLGGGLASHVLRHDKTKEYIAEAWALNSSPRDGIDSSFHDGLFVASVKGEILNLIRRDGFGAYESKYHDQYDLLRASSIYNHSRWVLTRHFLWYADLSDYLTNDRDVTHVSPPLQILKDSRFEACRQ